MTTLVKAAAVGPQEKRILLKQISFFNWAKKSSLLATMGLDEYIMGQVRRISPEAPVPILEVEEQDMRLGLSANVAQNVASLGGEPMLVSVVGDDTGASLLRELSLKTESAGIT